MCMTIVELEGVCGARHDSSDKKLLLKFLARWEINQAKHNLVMQRVTSCSMVEELQLPPFLISAGRLRFCKS